MDGSAAYAFPGTTDFFPLVSEAQQSGTMVLGLANAGADASACVRAANAPGLAGQMRIAALLLHLPDVHLLGLDKAGGLLLTESFCWDMNAQTRAFTRQLMAQEKPPFYPGMIHTGCYAGTLHFLKAVAALGVANAKSDGGSVIALMKMNPSEDDAFGRIDIRSDGRALVPACLLRIKSSAESAGPWDYYEMLSTNAADQAFKTLAEAGSKITSKHRQRGCRAARSAENRGEWLYAGISRSPPLYHRAPALIDSCAIEVMKQIVGRDLFFAAVKREMGTHDPRKND
jgi:branched-chain amino acid transport system substrate-binding protein